MKKFICILLIIFSVTFFGCSSKSTSSIAEETPQISENSSKDSSTESSLDPSAQTNEKKDELNKNVTISTPKTNPNKIISKPNKVNSSKDPKKTNSTSSENNPSLPNPSTNKPSETELMNLVLNAESALKRIFNCTSHNSKNIIVQNNYSYGEVTDFKSRNEMKELLSFYFTDAVIENILNKYLIEHDGKLYFCLGNAGLRVNYNTCKKEFSYEKDKITINLTEQYNSEEIFTETKTLGLINGKWLFTDFWYV